MAKVSASTVGVGGCAPVFSFARNVTRLRTLVPRGGAAAVIDAFLGDKGHERAERERREHCRTDPAISYHGPFQAHHHVKAGHTSEDGHRCEKRGTANVHASVGAHENAFSKKAPNDPGCLYRGGKLKVTWWNGATR